MNLKPIEQTNLYSNLDIFNELHQLYDSKKIPNKIIFSGQKGCGKTTLAYHLVNYIFSINEDLKYDSVNYKINDSNKSFNLVKKNYHPNFFLIKLNSDKKNIEIAQIREMISFSNKSSFNNDYKIIFIENVEYLNIKWKY